MSHDITSENNNFLEIPEDILFPDELCRYLKNEIHDHVRKNYNLQKDVQETNRNLEEKNARIKNLETKLKQFEDVNNSVLADPTHVTSAKIVEISKKLRDKCAESESFKTKYFKLEAYFNELKGRSNDEEIPKENVENQELRKEVKLLQDKLNFTINKLTEVKNVNSQLKNDLKSAKEFLEKETGESMLSLQQNPSWKGKSQIISELQDKNKELKERLKNLHDINQSKIRNSTKIQELTKENVDLKSQIDESRRKYEALRSRNKILDAEIKQIRTKLTIANEHYDKDQNLISTLTAQMSSFEEVKKTLLKEKDTALHKIKLERDSLKSQLEHYKNVVKSLNEELVERNKEIKEFKNKSNFDINKEFKDSKVSHLEAERIKLLDLLEIQNKRLQEERDVNSKFQGILRLEKQKSAKLEAALARNEAELLESNRYSSLTSLKSVRVTENSLKDQLELAEESIKALTTRLEIEHLERKMDLKEFSKILQNYKLDEESNKPNNTG